LVTFRVQAMLS